jgi:pilus assembly protein CpaB
MTNTRTLLVAALAILFGGAAGYSALRYLSSRPAVVQVGARGEAASVVLASRDLALGRVLEEADLQIVEWPAGAVPAGFAGSKEEVIGRSLISNVELNEAILPGKLADSGLLGIIPLIPEGMRAVSVAVNQVVGVAGFVTPQTKVDVILIMTPPGSEDPASKVILQNVQALAAGEEIRESEDGTPVTVQVVTLLVSPAEAEKLALADSQGEIRLALRNTLDLESVETLGVRASRLFDGIQRGPTRSTVRAAVPTARESAIEIYRGGVRTLIYY